VRLSEHDAEPSDHLLPISPNGLRGPGTGPLRHVGDGIARQRGLRPLAPVQFRRFEAGRPEDEPMSQWESDAISSASSCGVFGFTM
jgi:hypothetical protein